MMGDVRAVGRGQRWLPCNVTAEKGWFARISWGKRRENIRKSQRSGDHEARLCGPGPRQEDAAGEISEAEGGSIQGGCVSKSSVSEGMWVMEVIFILS